MSVKYFIDTNIFVYSFDSQNPFKQSRALELIAGSLESGDGVISTQVVQEFLNMATQKFKVPLRYEDCATYLHKVLNPLWQIIPDLALFEASLQIQAEINYSFYDSLILASAVRGACEILFSEDFQDGQQVHGVRIVNPFR